MAALAIVAALLWWPTTYRWAGDGQVHLRTPNGQQQAGLRAAMLATREQHGIGLARRYSYRVQQVDLSDSAYIRFSNCNLVNAQPAKCRATDGNYYQVQVQRAPDLQQVKDDDGVGG